MGLNCRPLPHINTSGGGGRGGPLTCSQIRVGGGGGGVPSRAAKYEWGGGGGSPSHWAKYRGWVLLAMGRFTFNARAHSLLLFIQYC